ncbi:MAG: MFS transporter [Chloroflexota bacterium]|nr:MFS transporter [Chloroflexota bacterium]MDE2841167.1 MFS transporter [Chloroflexota bacterium]MDE2931403.1 MFS transporter [Chloroflexota bacterium]
MERTFAALSVPAYRDMWLSMLVSFGGLQIAIVSRGYLAYDLSGSAGILGLVGVAMGLPMLFFSPIAGVLADRLDKRRLLISTQLFMFAVSLLLAILIHTGLIAIWHLVVFGFLQGIGFSLHMPTRSSLIPALVGRERLGNAIALNNSGRNMMTIVGPAIAGIVIVTPGLGTAGAFDITALCYAAAALFIMRLPKTLDKDKKEAAEKFTSQMFDGFHYVFTERTLLLLLSLAFIPLLLGRPYQMLLPVFQADVLGVDARWLGFLNAATGAGGLLGSLLVAYFSASQHAKLLQIVFGAFFGVSLLLFAYTTWLPLSLVLVGIVGLAANAYMSLNNTLVMLQTDQAYYGRVMSIYMMTFSLMPLAGFPMGILVDRWSAPQVVGIAGAVILLFVLAISLVMPDLREQDEGEQQAAPPRRTPAPL